MNARTLSALVFAATLSAGCASTSNEGTPSASPRAAQPAPFEMKGRPVDQSQAAAVLKESPRHGEWVDVPLAGQAPVKTWIVYPERADKAPVVIVIHEIFGMTEWVRATADQLAADGFVAVAPDLLSGKGPGGGATDSFKSDEVRQAIQKLTPDEAASRLNAVREFALNLPAANGHAGCIGFCWGGSQSFRYAAAAPKLGAAVVCYGTAPMKANQPDSETLGKIGCPVLGLYGGNDARVTATVSATEQAMRGLNKAYEREIYEGAGHGFVRQQSGAANTDAAKKGWERAVVFLRKHLE